MAIGDPSVSRKVDGGTTLGGLRVCTEGTANAKSFSYRLVKRIAQPMGDTKVIACTLEKLIGASLRALEAKAMAA